MKIIFKLIFIFSIIFSLVSCKESSNSLAFEPTEYTDDIAAKQIAIYNSVKKATSNIDLSLLKDKNVKYSINLIFDNDIIEDLLEYQFEKLIKKYGGKLVFDKEVTEGKDTKIIQAEYDYSLDITFLVLGTYRNRMFFYDEIIGKCIFNIETIDKNKVIKKSEYSSKYSFKKNIFTNEYTYYIYSIIILIVLLSVGIKFKKRKK